MSNRGKRVPVSEIHEMMSVPVVDEEGGPVDYGVKCIALRPAGQAHWDMLFTHAEDDHWVGILECSHIPARVSLDPESARYYANLAVLLGDLWSVIWEDPVAVIAQQGVVMDSMSARARRVVRQGEPFEVAAYRDQWKAQPPSDGELLRAELTGIVPFQGRN